MKVKIIVSALESGEFIETHSEVWSGEIEILRDNVYLTSISIMAEGEMQPICQIPFSLGKGHYLWIPPEEGLDINVNNPD